MPLAPRAGSAPAQTRRAQFLRAGISGRQSGAAWCPQPGIRCPSRRLPVVPEHGSGRWCGRSETFLLPCVANLSARLRPSQPRYTGRYRALHRHGQMYLCRQRRVVAFDGHGITCVDGKNERKPLLGNAAAFILHTLRCVHLCHASCGVGWCFIGSDGSCRFCMPHLTFRQRIEAGRIVINSRCFLPSAIRSFIHEGHQSIATWTWIVPTLVLLYKTPEYRAPSSSVLYDGSMTTAVKFFPDIQTVMSTLQNPFASETVRVWSQVSVTAPFYAGVGYSLGAVFSKTQGIDQVFRVRKARRTGNPTRVMATDLHRTQWMAVGCIVLPLSIARVAVPGWTLHGHRQAEKGAHVGDGTVEFLKVHIERLALGTARLLVESDALDVEAFEYWLVEKLARVHFIRGSHIQFDPADEV